MMDIREKSSEEDTPPFSVFTKFDESIIVNNAEEINSPVSTRVSTMSKNFKIASNDKSDDLDVNRFSNYGNSYEKTAGIISSDPSDSEETDDDDDDEDDDDDDIQRTHVNKSMDLYNPKEFEELDVCAEIKELFQNIIRYTPQKMELSYKLAPYISDFIPAVGDIDAFIKVARPDGVTDKVGLVVLDEPCANQSEPAVLHLQLRSQSKSADPRQQAVIKRIQDAEKNPKSIDKWIEDLNQLHRNKHPPAVRVSSAMPDIDTLMQEWPPEVEDKLNETQVDLSKFNCDLSHLVDIVCNLVDIPVRPENRLESLHTLFTLFLDIRDIKDSSAFSTTN